jgi:hypothetical protein
MKTTRRAIKVQSDGFWFAIVYDLIEHEDGTRTLHVMNYRAEATEGDLNSWLSAQPKK